MRILGVDPGYAIVGFGVLEYTGTTFTPITYGAITTAAETPFLRRLESIYRDFRTLFSNTIRIVWRWNDFISHPTKRR